MTVERQSNISLDECLEFGKHQSSSLEDVMNDDPDYVFWLLENEVVSLDEESLREAEKLKIL